MSSFRVNRISEDVKKELVDIIRVLKDPRIKHGVISIVKAEVTSDLSYATVYVSSLDGIEDAKEAVKGFESAAGYIRREIGNRLRLRRTPEFRFVADDSIAYSSEIFKKLDDIREKDRQNRQKDQTASD